MTSRREFLKAAGFGTAVLAAFGPAVTKGASATAKNPLPRWRGFHYHYFATMSAPSGLPQPQTQPRRLLTADALEEDFRIIRDFGFDMVRIGVQYWDWVDYKDKAPNGGPLAKDLLKIKESGVTRIDDAIERARKYGLHVHLDMHRGPGYNFRETALGQPNEPFSLWTDQVAQDAFVFYWDMFAKRYRGISPKELSFDLLNEPMGFAVPPKSYRSDLTRANYQKVITMAVNKIRETSPDRTILAEGLDKMSAADDTLPELIPLRVAQSMHCYAPGEFTHYRGWPDCNRDFLSAPPSWPAKLKDGSTFGREQLAKLHEPWGQLVAKGIGVHCGEFGFASPALPHDIAMKYMTDLLEILKGHQMGWTYLSFRGGNWGLLDGTRTDIAYEDYHGHKLNRQLLTLLQSH